MMKKNDGKYRDNYILKDINKTAVMQGSRPLTSRLAIYLDVKLAFDVAEQTEDVAELKKRLAELRVDVAKLRERIKQSQLK